MRRNADNFFQADIRFFPQSKLSNLSIALSKVKGDNFLSGQLNSSLTRNF